MSDDEPLREALKRVAVALKQTGLPFALTGGYAAWARGAPEPDHDVDFLVAADDVATIVESLEQAGLRVEQPPEDWLVKVWTDGAMVDLLFRASREPVGRALLDRADELEVLSVEMPVMPATEIVEHKLNAMDEHYCDLAALLPTMRALREQVDWDRVRVGTADNDFAAALLFLLERLRVIGPGATAVPAPGSTTGSTAGAPGGSWATGEQSAASEAPRHWSEAAVGE